MYKSQGIRQPICKDCAKASAKKFNFNNPVDRKKYNQTYYKKKRAEILVQKKEYAAKNIEKIQGQQHRYYLGKSESLKEAVHKYAQKNKMAALMAYGGPACKCCGITEIRFLTIDHVHGGGGKHRKETGSGSRFYLWLKRNKYPDGFQVLCYNCNLGRARNGGICPHQEIPVPHEGGALSQSMGQA